MPGKLLGNGLWLCLSALYALCDCDGVMSSNDMKTVGKENIVVWGWDVPFSIGDHF